MTTTHVAEYTRRASPDAPPTKVERRLTVTRKVKAAIDEMVWKGSKRAVAAQSAGLAEHSLYVALTRPHVKAYYLQQCEVLRLSGRARRIHRLEQVVEQDENKQAIVNACRALDGVDEFAPTAAAARLPGITIQIVQQSAHMVHERESEPKPLITHTSGSDEDTNS